MSDKKTVLNSFENKTDSKKNDNKHRSITSANVDMNEEKKEVRSSESSAAQRTTARRKQTAVNSNEDKIEELPGSAITLEEGTTLIADSGNSYVVLCRLGNPTDNGEADVFICEAEDHEYVAKIFRRKMVINHTKLEALQAISSKYIAPICDFGTYGAHYFEIYPYYNAGSLADELKVRTFTYEELKTIIIPELAQGLHALHEAHVLHRDVKPSNIMWKNRRKKTIVLIDFGLSSLVRNSSLSLVVSQVGFSMVYAPPEVLHGVYFDESDFYCMGIVIYELFCGKLPFSSDADAAASFVTRPENMPEDLYRLIRGLTYNDISHRNDSQNPNKRWAYNEVKDWLKGVDVPVPGMTIKPPPFNDRSIPPISFQERVYSDIDSLCKAMAIDWENGKAFVMRGMLLRHFQYQQRNLTSTQALWRSQIDDIMNNDKYDPDEKLIRIINSLCPERNYIACPIGCFNSLSDLGNHLIICLDNPSQDIRTQARENIELLLNSGALLTYATNNKPPQRQKNWIDEIKAFATQINSDRWGMQWESIAYDFSFFASQNLALELGDTEHTILKSVDDLMGYLVQAEKKSVKELYEVCGQYFLDGSHQIKPKVYGWLHNLGCKLEDFNL